MDLSGFKAINDAHGHEAGNAALKEAGREVFFAAFGVYPESPPEKLPMTPTLIPFRKSGDEFVVLTEGAADARKCATQLAEKFGSGLDVNCEVNGNAIRLNVRGAVGFCVRDDNQTTLKDLLDRADAACRVAKFDSSVRAVEWNVSNQLDEVDSKRKSCPSCRTTTTILFRRSHLKASALTRCGNCDALFESAQTPASETGALASG